MGRGPHDCPDDGQKMNLTLRRVTLPTVAPPIGMKAKIDQWGIRTARYLRNERCPRRPRQSELRKEMECPILRSVTLPTAAPPIGKRDRILKDSYLLSGVPN